MKTQHLVSAGFLAAAVLTAAALPARADPCRDYSRTVNFPNGTARTAEGTACQGADGVWRITEEHIVPLAAPLPPEVVYAPPYYAAYPPAPYYYPYYGDPYYYGPSYFSFGFGFHDGWRDGGHWDRGGGGFHHR